MSSNCVTSVNWGATAGGGSVTSDPASWAVDESVVSDDSSLQVADDDNVETWLVVPASALDAHNTPERLDAVAPAAHAGVRAHARGLEVELPAHSYVTVSLDLR